MSPEFLKQLPDQAIASATADGAYDARECHAAIADRRVVLQKN